MSAEMQKYVGTSITKVQRCPYCNTNQKCRQRNFSDQIWATLVLWKEIQASAISQPLCDDCYNELREVLIDRASELEMIHVSLPGETREAGHKAR